jgi:hypothetical protein
MHFRTFLKTGVEVLSLGGQHWESNAWPPEHWKSHKGRWRLFTPGIDDFLNESLKHMNFGESVDKFVLLLEVADFQSWGEGIAFTGPGGFSRYKHKTNEVWSVGRIDWTEVQYCTTREQLLAYTSAFTFAAERVVLAKRKPKNFDINAFSAAVVERLQAAKVSQISRSTYALRGEA